MAGLLGGMDFSDPNIALAAGLLSGRGNFGANLSLGLLGAQQAAQAQREQQSRQLRDQLVQMQAEAMRRAQAQQAALDAAAKKNVIPGQPQMLPTDQELPSGPAGPSQFNLPGYLNDVMSLDPMRALQLQSQIAKMNKPQTAMVAPGSALIDVRTGKPLYTAPDKLPTGMVMGPNGPQFMPAYLQGQQQIRAAGKPQVSVNTTQENQFNKTLGEQQAKDYSSLMQADLAATTKINKLDRLGQLLEMSGNTGTLAPVSKQFNALAASLGFNADPKLAYQQAADALSNEVALSLRDTSTGAGMPGAMSDKDREFLQAMVPGLSKTPEGNKILLETGKRLAQRRREVANLARKYKQRTGRFDEGFYQELAQYSDSHPLFSDLASSMGQPQAPTAPAAPAQGRIVDFNDLQ